MENAQWVPGEVDVRRPSVARVYDYYLGGSHNFEADREMARRVIEMSPNAVPVARANRAFLRRAVRFCMDAGIRQFLDIGSGIPTVGNVHDVAQQLDPSARVVYVDIDPIAVAHSRAILEGNPNATVIQADLRDPAAILAHPECVRLLDLDRPVAVLLVSVMHFVADSDDPAGIVGHLAGAVVPDSHLVFSQATLDGAPAVKVNSAKELYSRTDTQLTMRSREDIENMLAGWDLVEPGLTYLSWWRPESPDDVDPDAPRSVFLAAVGRKP
ncbi:MAG TPA: SAM-dependent methyltransferase [Pseudonocardiaceae bacterium]